MPAGLGETEIGDGCAAEADPLNTTPHDPGSGQRRYGAAEGGIRWSGGVLLVGLGAVLVLLLSPYLALLPFVGSFPSEDVREPLPGAAFVETLCLPERSDPGTGPRAAPSPPALTVEQGLAPMATGLFEKSSSVYFSERSGKLIALDRVDEEDQEKLLMLENRRSVSRENLSRFLEESDRYYPVCEAPRTYRGFTEAYWATKGASVLHHWVHLYEGGLGGSVHAQYGYAIPWGVRSALEWSSSLGPTSFVRLSWLVFALCGVAYVAIFLHLFRDHPRLALAALLLKVFLFTKIGAFALLLAPGFHWYRELVLIALPAIVLSTVSRSSAVGLRRALPRYIAAGAALLLCFLVEPTFFVVAVICAALAVLWGNSQAIANHIRANRRYFLVALVVLAGVGLVFVALQSSNLAYIAQKLRGDDLVVPAAKYVWRTRAVCVVAIGFLLVLRGRPQNFLQGYFTLVALFASLYYFVTPDAFHFYKFAEYAVPAGAALAAFVVDRYGGWVRSHVTLPRSLLTGATAVAFVVLAQMVAGNLRANPAPPERRIKDSAGVPYFTAASFTINGRVIQANMSEGLAEHLRAFPASTRFDFMVSPFDKYVTFLYDRTNGFSAPDFFSWLDSSDKLERALRLTARSERPVLVLLDEASLDVDTRFAIQEAHPSLGGLQLASKLNLKARLRASDLASELMARCESVGIPGAKSGWRLLRCGHGE
jgi:hypothetical protein